MIASPGHKNKLHPIHLSLNAKRPGNISRVFTALIRTIEDQKTRINYESISRCICYVI